MLVEYLAGVSLPQKDSIKSYTITTSTSLYAIVRCCYKDGYEHTYPIYQAAEPKKQYERL